MADYRVVDIVQLEGDLSAVADALRVQSGKTEALTFPDDYVSTVAQLGGGAFEAGKQAEYDAFWDAVQEQGNRTDYRYGFAGQGWTSETFRPKYDIIPAGNASYMFQNTKIAGDLVELMNGKKLDLSQATSATALFNSATELTRVGVIDARKIAKPSLFDWCWSLETVDRFLFTDLPSGGFTGCDRLKNIVFDGTITSSGFDIHWSTMLSGASITSLINALSADSSGCTVTLSRTAVDNAFTAEEWETLTATKPNWTISLI